MSLSITKTTRTYPKLPYAEMQTAILGSSYNASLVFIGAKRAKQLNQTTRGKSYVPNVLSFPLTPKMGEIYITPAIAKVEAPKFGLSPKSYIGYLFIHGCLHLKGLDHGPTMDRLEAKYLKQFNLTK